MKGEKDPSAHKPASRDEVMMNQHLQWIEAGICTELRQLNLRRDIRALKHINIRRKVFLLLTCSHFKPFLFHGLGFFLLFSTSSPCFSLFLFPSSPPLCCFPLVSPFLSMLMSAIEIQGKKRKEKKKKRKTRFPHPS